MARSLDQGGLMLPLSIVNGLNQKYGLHDSIGYHTTLVARIVERRVEEALKEFGLTRLGWCILLAVAEEGLQNPSDIAKFVGIDRTATSRTLRQLEDDGLIGRAIGRKDRRMTVVSLTQKGFDRLIAAVPTCQENMSHFNAKLTEVEQRELRRLMTKLRDGEDMGLTRF